MTLTKLEPRICLPAMLALLSGAEAPAAHDHRRNGEACVELMGDTYRGPLMLTEFPRHQEWAAIGEARDQAIREARARGIMDIEIVQVEPIVPNVGGLQPDDDSWCNNCAEDYYDVRSLRANQPGWDK